MKIFTVIGLMLVFSQSNFAHESNVADISYKNANKFVDFRKQFSTRSKLTHMKSDFSEQLNSIARKYLNQGENIKINLTNIDIAGRIDYIPREIRRVDVNTDRTLVEFDYELIDAKGDVIAQGHEKLKGFTDRIYNKISFKKSNSYYKYEMYLMETWFKKLSNP